MCAGHVDRVGKVILLPSRPLDTSQNTKHGVLNCMTFDWSVGRKIGSVSCKISEAIKKEVYKT